MEEDNFYKLESDNDKQIKEKCSAESWLGFYNKYWRSLPEEIPNRNEFNQGKLKDESYQKLLELIDNTKEFKEKKIEKGKEKEISKRPDELLEEMFECINLIYGEHENDDSAYKFFNNEKLKEIFEKERQQKKNFSDRILYLIFVNSDWDASEEDIVSTLFKNYEGKIENAGWVLLFLIKNSKNFDGNSIKALGSIFGPVLFGFVGEILGKCQNCSLDNDSLKALFDRNGEYNLSHYPIDNFHKILLEKMNENCMFKEKVLINVFLHCAKDSLNIDELKKIINKFNGNSFSVEFLQVCYETCDKKIFDSVDEENYREFDNQFKGLFEKLQKIHNTRRYLDFSENIPSNKENEQNKSIGNRSIIGCLLFGLLAIGAGLTGFFGVLGFGMAVFLGTTFAAVSLVCVLFGIFYIWKFRSIKKLNEMIKVSENSEEFQKQRENICENIKEENELQPKNSMLRKENRCDI